MWINSDGDQIFKSFFKKIFKQKLQTFLNDASEILDILLLTNSYYPSKIYLSNNLLENKI